ncbi:MAG: hypothetical protein HQL66_05650 [Magnetococcales bacterium]|nr:hypothetical protein [Magnetococcales bacterium]
MPNQTLTPLEKKFRQLVGDERVNALARDARQSAIGYGQSTHDLSVVDLAALRYYTGLTNIEGGERNHQLINSALRNEDLEEANRLAPVIETLKTAIAKLPDMAADVVRATDLPDHVAEGIAPGSICSDAGFMSTAIGETKFKGKYMFFIKSRTGKWIEPFSFHPEQKEVLYPPGREFTIISVTPGDDGKIKVELEEK